ncbi:hypothetical protein ABBQ38_004628 [Trebouxia sp. C0009 RCD-2024]
MYAGTNYWTLKYVTSRVLNGRAGTAGAPQIQVCCNLGQGQPAQGQQQQGPDIRLLDPLLQKQWDHDANAWLGDILIKPYSNRKVSWLCDQCPDGHPHTWSAPVSNRTAGRGCPQCRGYHVCQHNSLATKAPLVAAEWDYGANSCTPHDVVAHSERKFSWQCREFGHKWKATANHRVSKRKSACPRCADRARTKKRIRHPTFAECEHPLLAEWDHRRNAAQDNFPDNTRLKSNKQIFWLCTKCPVGLEHSWPAQPRDRTSRQPTGCPFCTGVNACRCNSLQALYPDTAAEWDHGRNHSQPSDHTGHSRHLAWWFSPQRGSWQQTINARTSQVQQRMTRQKLNQQRQQGLEPGPTEV